MTGRRSPAFLDELRARTALVPLIGRYVRLRPAGRREAIGQCPFHGERSPSFTVSERKGFFHCFGCGAHGDAVAFVMQHLGLGFAEAVGRLAADAGMAVPRSEGLPAAAPPRPLAPAVRRDGAAELAAEQARQRGKLLRWWEEAGQAAGPGTRAILEAYLRFRAIDPERSPVPATIRLHPALPYWVAGGSERPVLLGHWPAMVAAIAAVDRRITGLHITYLQPDGRGKAAIVHAGQRWPAKKMRGTAWGGAIRLDPPGPRLGLAEGIESGWSVRLARPDLPVWVAGSLGNIAGSGDPTARGPADPRRPGKCLPTDLPDMDAPGIVLPEIVREVILLEDADGDVATARQLYDRASRRWVAQGIRVRRARPPPGLDFNGLLQRAAS